MSDLYNINNWAATTFYKKNSIVINGNLYYYSTLDHTSSSSFATDLSNSKWNGVISYNGEQKPFFFWRPSYNYRIPIKPLVDTIKFSEGYSQDLDSSIGSNLLNIDLQFNDRDLDETTAILHFLNTRKNQRFFYVPPQPYGIISKFVCLEFEHTQDFYDKYSISAKFEQRIL